MNTMVNKALSVGDHIPSELTGRVKLFTFPAAYDEELIVRAFTDSSFSPVTWAVPFYEADNLVVDDAQTVVANLLQRNLADYIPQYIVIGAGGDLEQDAKVDFGSRVAPAVTDGEVRDVVARLPIIQVIPESPDSNTWDYVAIARPHEALTPSLNELGLEAANHTLISHFVTAPAAGEERAQKFVKSSLEYLVVRWTMTFSLG